MLVYIHQYAPWLVIILTVNHKAHQNSIVTIKHIKCGEVNLLKASVVTLLLRVTLEHYKDPHTLWEACHCGLALINIHNVSPDRCHMLTVYSIAHGNHSGYLFKATVSVLRKKKQWLKTKYQMPNHANRLPLVSQNFQTTMITNETYLPKGTKTSADALSDGNQLHFCPIICHLVSVLPETHIKLTGYF